MTISVILSLIILTPIAKLFVNPMGINVIENFDGVTDLRLQAYSFYPNLGEGFSPCKYNNEGYSNLFDYENGMSIDVLLMGNSNILASNIIQKYSTANLLINLTYKKIYNIGMFKHYFATCAVNLKKAVEKYKPSEYIVLEIMSASFTDEELKNILSQKVEKVRVITSKETNKSDFVRRIYYRYVRPDLHKILTHSSVLNLIYTQLLALLKHNLNEKIISYEYSTSQNNPVLLSQVLKRMAETAKSYGAKLIIAYHPLVELENDGSLKILGDNKAVKVFADACEQNGIYFIDMSKRFLSEYKKNYTVPTGFFNTSIASGHMNKDGHRMFAEEIYKLMQKIEK